MTVFWDNEEHAVYEPIIMRALKYVNAPESSEVSISFADKDDIKQLNREYRGMDSPTDVLSFPLTDKNEWAEVKNRPLLLGDVIICDEIAREQANTYGHTYEREINFLLVHGLLHLAGYDHMNEEDEKKMRGAQRKILGSIK